MAAEATPAGAPSFWLRFARTLPMMLVFGIVGPLFIGFYFLIDDPTAEWLLWWGLAIILFDVLIAAGVAWFGHRGEAKMYRLHRTGRPATAEILEMVQTGTQINNQPLMKLRLRISGPDVNPFEVRVRKIVPLSFLPLLHRGALAVLVDPETQEWEIDWQATSAGAGRSLPAASLAPGPSAEERLVELDGLKAKDLISPEEYAATRQRILDSI
jgi:hypothetical protein